MPIALHRRRALLCVGPGGVGKTTCAAALALAAAQTGRHVVVVTIDPSLRLAQALGLEGPGPDPRPVEVDGEGCLHAMLLDAGTVFDGIVRSCAESLTAADTILGHPIYRATTRHLGGALEYAAMALVHGLLQDRRFDLVILDTPPTANAIEFLDAPARIREVATNPAARLLLGSSVARRLLGVGSAAVRRVFESMGGGRFLGELADFLREFSQVVAEFHRRAGDFEDLLRAPSTGVILATSPTEFSVREAQTFLAELRARGLHVDAVVLNGVEPDVPEVASPEEVAQWLRDGGGEADPGAVLRLRERWAALRRESTRADTALASLADCAGAGATVVAVPRYDPPPASVAELSGLGRRLLGIMAPADSSRPPA